MARNHAPKPLYGAAKQDRAPLYCAHKGEHGEVCKRDALAGYRNWNGTYDWRCREHMRVNMPKAVPTMTRERLKALLGL